MIGSADLGLSLEYFKENSFYKDENDMLISLINFCLDFLLFKENLDYWSLENIKKYKKEELFKRFCLDVFLALKKLDDSDSLNSNYKEFLDKVSFLEGDLKEREKELSKSKKPDFNKGIIS